MAAQPTGLAVDSFGGPVIDPTKNVLDLVNVEKEHAKELREADIRFHDTFAAAETKRQDDLSRQRDAYEIRLGDVRDRYEARISVMTAAANEKTTTLLTVQFDRLRDDLSAQIATMGNTMQQRIGQLENFRASIAGQTTGASDSRSSTQTWIMLAIAGATFTLGYLTLKPPAVPASVPSAVVPPGYVLVPATPPSPAPSISVRP